MGEHFARRMALELGWPEWPGFAKAAMDALKNHDWPGNVRELKNAVERAVYRWGDPVSPIDDIPFDPFESPWRPVKSAQASRRRL